MFFCFIYTLNKNNKFMFKKTWKTIKIFLIVIVILICVPHSLFPKKESKGQKHELKSQNRHGISNSKTSAGDTIPDRSSQKNSSMAK
jgi:hypothetical protein